MLGPEGSSSFLVHPSSALCHRLLKPTKDSELVSLALASGSIPKQCQPLYDLLVSGGGLEQGWQWAPSPLGPQL